MVVEKKILDASGDLPSEKNADDLVDVIWTHFWKLHQEEKRKNIK